LGIEAISRGAAKCCFADRGRDLLSRLLRNIQAVGAADRCVIWRGDVGTNLAGWLGELDGQVDLAFVDPPYPLTQAWDWAKAADMIFRPLARRLTAEGLVVLRTSVRLELPELLGGLAIQRARRYGGMAVTMYGHQGQAARPEEAR
jgi:16S rRNA G966 N2-methylase RsmD